MKKGKIMKKSTHKSLDLQLFAGEVAKGVNFDTGENESDAAGHGENEFENGEPSFDELINGKYKDDFARRTQQIIDKRFKKTKELESFYDNASPLLERISEKYGVEKDDFEAISAAIDGDYEGNGDFEENGVSEGNGDFDENGVSESGNAEEEIKQKMRNIVSSWVKDGETLKSTYPDFDLRNELKDPLFSKLIKNGVSVKDAFETVHKDEILSGAMAYTAKAVREQLVSGLESKSLRPLENGLVSQSGIVTKTDVNALTSQDILKILKKVESGVQVKF